MHVAHNLVVDLRILERMFFNISTICQAIVRIFYATYIILVIVYCGL